MVRLDDEMCREVYSLLLLVPRGLPVLCLAARDLAQAGTQTGLRFFSRAVPSTAREKRLLSAALAALR